MAQFEGDPNDFSDIHRDEANWNAYVKKRQEEREKFNLLMLMENMP